MGWSEEEKRKIAQAIKKLYVQKNVVHKQGSRGQDIESVTYLPTLVVDIRDHDVLQALRGKYTTRHFRTGKKDGIIWGRRVKRVLEEILDYLTPSQRDLATVVLAFPSGKGKRDVKERLFKLFYKKLEEVHRLQRLSEGDPTLRSVWVCDSPNPQAIEGGSSATHLEIDERYVLDVVEGLVFSDAYISKPPGSYFTLGTTNRQYVEQVYRILHPMLNCRLRNYWDKSINKRRWRLTVTSAKLFKRLREEWYGEDGGKKLPRDFKWTPVKLNVAYCGDGSLDGGAPGICLHSFSATDVERLVKSFEDLGVYGALHEVRKGQFYFRIFQDCARVFFDYIGDTPVIPCFSYKWQYKAPTTRSLDMSKISEEDMKELVGAIRKLNVRRLGRTFEITLTFERTAKVASLFSSFGQTKGQVLLRGTHVQRFLARALPFVEDKADRERFRKVIEFPLRRHFSEAKEKAFVDLQVSNKS